MNKIFQFLKKQRQDYLVLNQDTRKLLLSFFICSMASPMVSVFVNIFLWRQSQDALLIILYNAGLFFGVPVGFYINGLFLKKFLPQKLFALGCSLKGIIPLLLIFYNTPSTSASLFFGTLFGIGFGIYFANKHFLTLHFTSSKYRTYFISMEAALGVVADLSAPIIIAWALVIGAKWNLYSLTTAYQSMAVVGVLLHIFAGLQTIHIHLPFQKLKNILPQNISPTWRSVRKFHLIDGIADSATAVLPVLLILVYVGQELEAGSLQSLSAFIGMFAIYTIGKSVKKERRIFLLLIWLLTLISASFIYAVSFSVTGILIYFTMMAFFNPFRGVAFTALIYDSVEQEKQKTHQHAYSYLLDREVFLGMSRVTTLVVCYFLFSYSSYFTLRYGLLVATSTQLVGWVLAKKLAQSQNQITIETH